MVVANKQSGPVRSLIAMKNRGDFFADKTRDAKLAS
jgi:hypothetical protein